MKEQCKGVPCFDDINPIDKFKNDVLKDFNAKRLEVENEIAERLLKDFQPSEIERQILPRTFDGITIEHIRHIKSGIPLISYVYGVKNPELSDIKKFHEEKNFSISFVCHAEYYEENFEKAKQWGLK